MHSYLTSYNCRLLDRDTRFPKLHYEAYHASSYMDQNPYEFLRIGGVSSVTLLDILPVTGA